MTTADLPTSSRSTPPMQAAAHWIQAGTFVAVWIGLGYLLPVDANGYLLLGIPLTVVFQKLVRRRPLRELWVRAGPRFAVDRRGTAVAAVLLLTPAYVGVRAVAAGSWGEAGWAAAAVAGAVAAGYALRHTSIAATVRAAVPATLIGVALMGVALMGVALMGVAGGAALVAAGGPLRVWDMLGAALLSAALYFPVSFVLEEVTFRGALDTHVHQPGASRGWPSALAVSALWGLWHLPLADRGTPLVLTLVQLLGVHCLIGVPLSFAWRRTGNLAAPALAHSLIDAVRNGLRAGL